MASHTGDGIRVVRDGGAGQVVRLLLMAAAAIAVATAVLIVVIRRAPASPPDVPMADAAVAAAPRPTPASPTVSPSRAVDPAAAPTTRAVDKMRARRRATAAAAEGAKPEIDARDVIPYLRAQGERGGIAAFDPPGTDPPKRGIVVPEDFPLPEGYVRHYQSTDDGEQLAPILMFHPDFEFVDESGQPVPLPESRVVPPELAPPGLPIDLLDVPAEKARPVPAP